MAGLKKKFKRGGGGAVTYAKISPKMVNPRDVVGKAGEEEEEEKDEEEEEANHFATLRPP